MGESLRDLSLSLGVDSQHEVGAHVGLHGGRNDHVLSRLQTVVLDQIPLIAVILVALHRPVPPEEHRLQTSLRRLGRRCISERLSRNPPPGVFRKMSVSRPHGFGGSDHTCGGSCRGKK